MIKPVVGFTKEHLEYLEKTFPELTGETDTSTLLLQSGKRAVVKHIEYLVQKNVKRVLD